MTPPYAALTEETRRQCAYLRVAGCLEAYELAAERLAFYRARMLKRRCVKRSRRYLRERMETLAILRAAETDHARDRAVLEDAR